MNNLPTSDLERRRFLQVMAAGTAASFAFNAFGAPGEAAPVSGANYATQCKPSPVVKPGEFLMAAAFLDHGHIYGQCNGLIEAGADLRFVYDPDPKKVEAFCKT